MSKIFYVLFLLILLSSTLTYCQDFIKGKQPPTIKYTSFLSGAKTEITWPDSENETILIDFWATWCAPCIESIPHLNHLIDMYKRKNIRFISITYEPAELVNKFLAKHPMKSEVGLDTSFEMFRILNAWAIPNIILINSKGIISGRIHPAKLNENVIDTILAGGVPEVENTPENLYIPSEAEKYFRSLLKPDIK